MMQEVAGNPLYLHYVQAGLMLGSSPVVLPKC